MNARSFSRFAALLLALTALAAPSDAARKSAGRPSAHATSSAKGKKATPKKASTKKASAGKASAKKAPAKKAAVRKPVRAVAPASAAKAATLSAAASEAVLDGSDDPFESTANPASAPLSYAQLGKAAEARGEMGVALGYYIRALPSAPDDIAVIMGAARGALATGDADAATNFFSRALTLQPANGMARAGVARALVLAQRPKEALRQFDLAERYGIDPPGYADDRGLAHDLRGEQRRAQQDYRLALTAHPRDPQTLQRYALSLAIQGDRNSARRMLDPLMAGGGDGATRRTLAFIDALTGDSASAVRLAAGAVGANQAAAMAPFFSRLPLLSASERAYAVHFGVLPPTASGMAAAEAKPVPLRVTRSTIDPATARSLAAGDTPPVSKPGNLSAAEITAIAASLQGGGIINARPPALTSAEKPQEPTPAKKQAEAKEECKPAKPFKGAKGKAVKKAAACPTTPTKAKEKLPERFWVQISSGANKADLPKAWAKLKTGSGGKALGSRAPYVASAGRSNRLLVGPFADKDAAQDYLNTLTRAGLSGFTWTSPAGSDVPKLPLK